METGLRLSWEPCSAVAAMEAMREPLALRQPARPVEPRDRTMVSRWILPVQIVGATVESQQVAPESVEVFVPEDH